MTEDLLKPEPIYTYEIHAVDFDGTLVRGKYPDIGKPNLELIERLKKLQARGDKLVLWTCREGEALQQAVDYCRDSHNLNFDAVNENIKAHSDYFGGVVSRKVFAHYYWDDKAICVKFEEDEI